MTQRDTVDQSASGRLESRNLWFLFAMIIVNIGCEDRGDSLELADYSVTSTLGEGGGDAVSHESVSDQGVLVTQRGDSGALSDSGQDPECVPARAEWAQVAPIIESRCGLCHGAELQFGAPYSLATYEDFTPGRAAVAAQELSWGEMPPFGQEPLSVNERMKLLAWLSCGEVGETPGPLPAGGFMSTRPILTAPATPPEGVDFFEVRAQNYQVPTERNDRYECFTVTAPVGEERLIRRVETIVDDARVLHHIVLIPEAGGRPPNTHSECDGDNPFALIYAWAPGQGALHFAEGGIKLSPGQSLTLQIHYNNRANHEDAIDNSGVRVYHGPVEGPEIAVLTLGPVGFEVPPRSRGEVTGYCELLSPTQLIASFPHMHEMGARFQQSIVYDWLDQPDGQELVWEDIITLDGWDFGSQYVYETPISLSAGDLIKTSCVYENTRDRPLRFGENTHNEMCFNFAYVSPPIDISLCNQNEPPSKVYTPGACAPEESASWRPRPISVEMLAGRGREITESAPLEPGDYRVDRAEVFFDPTLVENYGIDLVQSGIRGRGVARWSEEGELTLDLNNEVRVVLTRFNFSERADISWRGLISEHVTTDEEDPLKGSLHVSFTCGSSEYTQIWVTPDPSGVDERRGGWLEFPYSLGPIDLMIRIHLTEVITE